MNRSMELVPVIGYAHKRFTSWRNARRIVAQSRGVMHEGVLYVFGNTVKQAAIERVPVIVGEWRLWMSEETPGDGGPLVKQLETGEVYDE